MNEANMLSTYKEQQGVERGFRFIKDPLFHLSGVFLKKPERIDALMMVMTLCLMVYNAGQYQVRTRGAGGKHTQSSWKANKEAYITMDISENEWYPSGSHTGPGQLY
ncbi:MAG: transposase [Paraglaciecola sp.]|jgi:transposase